MLNGYSVSCDHWYHTMCETLSPLKELSLSDARYQCVACSGVEDINEVYQRKINTLIEEEDVLKGIEIDAKNKM